MQKKDFGKTVRANHQLGLQFHYQYQGYRPMVARAGSAQSRGGGEDEEG